MYKVVLNLRGKFVKEQLIQEDIEKTLDKIIYPLLRRTNYRVTIIVGKGNSSSSMIQGKNLIRYYTEIYLEKVGIDWRNGNHFEGQEGVIIVEG